MYVCMYVCMYVRYVSQQKYDEEIYNETKKSHILHAQTTQHL